MIGCGNFGESHLQAFRAVPTGEITALYDPDRNRVERLAKKFGIAKICNSLEEICSLPELQAIDVVTPEGLHAESVLHALASGKHVFVEKPLALDLKQCKQMIDAAEAANKVLMVGHLLRFETK